MILDTIDIHINITFTRRLSFWFSRYSLLSIIGVSPPQLPVASQLEDWIQPIIENVQNLRHVHTRVPCNYFDQWILNLLMTGLKTWDRFIMQLNYW